MKKVLLLAAALTMISTVSFAQMANATASQSLSLAVQQVYKISATSSVPALTISDGVAGTNDLTTVSDNSTVYSITHNNASKAKITAQLSSAMSAGYVLKVNLASTKGTTAGNVDISGATAQTVVSGINPGADANQGITYTFDALASAGALANTARTVTLTLTAN